MWLSSRNLIAISVTVCCRNAYHRLANAAARGYRRFVEVTGIQIPVTDHLDDLAGVAIEMSTPDRR